MAAPAPTVVTLQVDGQAASTHTSGMVALAPSDPDAARLAVAGGEPVEELHVTLAFLGEATQLDEATRRSLEGELRLAAEGIAGPITGEAFALSLFNPAGDEPCWVLLLGGEELDQAHNLAWLALDDLEFPGRDQNHSPWVAHLTLEYLEPGQQPEVRDELLTRLGPITFDRLRLALGDDVLDFPLGEEATVPWHVESSHADCPSDRPWAVVKDDDGEVEGCHATEEDAKAQLRALYAAEGEAAPGAALARGVAAGVRRSVGTVALAANQAIQQAFQSNGGGEIVESDVPLTYIKATGSFDIHGEWGREAQRLVSEGFLRGVSVTLDDVGDSDIELIWPEGDPPDEEDGIDALFMEPELAVFLHGRIIDATLTAQPALQEASIEVDPDDPNHWRGTLAVEGKRTGDGRMFAEESLEWRELPLALMWQPATDDGHDSSYIVGRIEHIERVLPADAAVPGGSEGTLSATTLGAVGTHDTGTSDASWDGAASEARLASPLPVDRARAAYAWLADGAVQDGEVRKSDCKFIHHEVGANGAPGVANLTACSTAIGVLNGGRGGTSIPAADRQGVYNHLAHHIRAANLEPPPLASLAEVEALLAAAPPLAPPLDWFTTPTFSEPTPLRVTDDGRVYGHLARWGTCHTSFPGACVTPPREESFDYFTTGEVATADGSLVPVGQLTLGTGHAPATLGARPAVEHYDHTGHAVADVTAGADAWGIWVAGALRPTATALDVRTLRASALSGDWRRIGGKLRLVAALVVNVPGFPIPRTRAHVREGAQTALVASGVVADHSSNVIDLSARVADRIAASIGRDRHARARELRDRIHPSL